MYRVPHTGHQLPSTEDRPKTLLTNSCSRYVVKTENFKKVQIESSDELRAWLLENHAQFESIWLVTFKKVVPEKYVSTSEVLDELISFGWIDGIRRKLDDQRTMQLISPRQAEHWTKTYKDRAARLTELGKMHTAGLNAIAASKASGMWNFMDDVDNLVIPKDLAQALAKRPAAEDFFHAINPSSKRFVLRWLKLTKTDKTRTSRIEKIVSLSAQGKKLPGS